MKALDAKHSYATRKLIEDKANGSPIITMLKTIPGQSIVPFDPGSKSKQVRADAVVPTVAAGSVIIPHDSEAHWVRGWLSEVTKFDKGQYDDQVDAFTQALLHFTQKSNWYWSA
jgi:predicted phage terminase large subunit-like protein